MTNILTIDELRVWLEWAGARLVAMPGNRVAPKQTRVLWPDYAQDIWEVTEFRNNQRIRISGPTSAEIPIMEEILLLPNICEWVKIRRVIHARSLIHPFTERHLYSWDRIAKKLETHPVTARRWYKKGLNEIVIKANPQKVCLIADFIREAQNAHEKPLD